MQFNQQPNSHLTEISKATTSPQKKKKAKNKATNNESLEPPDLLFDEVHVPDDVASIFVVILGAEKGAVFETFGACAVFELVLGTGAGFDAPLP